MTDRRTLPPLATEGSELHALRIILGHIEAAQERLPDLRHDTEEVARWRLKDARAVIWSRLATLEQQIIAANRVAA